MLALSYEAPRIWINLSTTQVPVIEIKQRKFVMCQKKKKKLRQGCCTHEFIQTVTECSRHT